MFFLFNEIILFFYTHFLSRSQWHQLTNYKHINPEMLWGIGYDDARGDPLATFRCAVAVAWTRPYERSWELLGLTHDGHIWIQNSSQKSYSIIIILLIAKLRNVFCLLVNRKLIQFFEHIDIIKSCDILTYYIVFFNDIFIYYIFILLLYYYIFFKYLILIEHRIYSSL